MHNFSTRLLANHHLVVTFTLAAVLAGTLWAYYPGLSGGFIFDDLTNISQNSNLKSDKLDEASLAQAALSRGDGNMLYSRAISMVSFSLNHYFSGFHPYPYKVTNLAIHLLNGVCIFVLTRLVLSAYASRHDRRLTPAHVQTLSVVVCAAWLLHPINLTNVLYVVQRMNSLSALFTLLGLICYMHGRLRLDRGRGGWTAILAAFVVLTPLAVLCKENGALLPLYAFVLELSLFGFRTGTPRRRLFLGAVFTVFLLLPLAGALAALAVDSGWLLGGYVHRPFTLGQRLLSEARALWFYLFITFVPDIRYMGLFHDDFAVSRSLTEPLSTLPAVLGIFGLLAAAFLCRRRAPLVTLGILFFFAGHSMESTIIPLELVFEHRNYLPVYGVLLPAFYYLAHPLLRWNPFGLRHGAAVLAVALFTFATTVRASQWSTPLSFNIAETTHHPRSPRANTELGRVFYQYVQDNAHNDVRSREKYFQIARRYFARATLVDKRYSAGLFGMIVLYGYMDRTVPAGIVNMLAYRLQHQPFSNNDCNLLVQLVSCHEQGICHLQRAQLDHIMRSALRNKTLMGADKGSVLTSISRYFGLYSNYRAALHFSREAAEAVPGVLQYRLNVAYWLITMGRLEEAERELQKVKAVDTLGRHANYIEAQEKRIRDARFLRNLGGRGGAPGAGGPGEAGPKPAAPAAEKKQ